MPRLKPCSWISLVVLPFSIIAAAADFDPANNIFRAGFDPSICSNRLIEDAEQCDDGNLNAADGCDGVCRIETAFTCSGTPSLCVAPSFAEIEPNNTLADADANGALFATSRTVLGAISPVADLDTFRIDVPQVMKVVRFESFAPSEGDCSSGVTTTFRLRNSVGTQILTDSGSGIASCAALVFGFTAGTYYLQVEETGNNSSVAAYALQARFPNDFGSELEPPGTTGSNDVAATSELALVETRDGVVLGDHTVTADADYYAITVPAGTGVRAEIIEGNRQLVSCESNALDSLLTLYAADGATVKVTDDDDGRGFCSLIDGTGAAPLDAGARNTSGITETWYLAVRSSSGAPLSTTMFTYRLAVTVR